MKVERIIPCVCIDHKPDSEDSVHYGMPHIKVAGGKPFTFYTPYCPNCGCMGITEYKSDYLALKAWNETQQRLWTMPSLKDHIPGYNPVLSDDKGEYDNYPF